MMQTVPDYWTNLSFMFDCANTVKNSQGLHLNTVGYV